MVIQSPKPLESHNKDIVKAFYKALAAKEIKKVVEVLAADLEWWFHGPHNCHHMMKLLTGKASGFRFEPRRISVLDDRVIVEGWEGAKAYWVHVWTMKDGKLVQFREYFNTWLTVTELVGRRSPTRWQSQPCDLATGSLPGLILAI